MSHLNLAPVVGSFVNEYLPTIDYKPQASKDNRRIEGGSDVELELNQAFHGEVAGFDRVLTARFNNGSEDVNVTVKVNYVAPHTVADVADDEDGAVNGSASFSVDTNKAHLTFNTACTFSDSGVLVDYTGFTNSYHVVESPEGSDYIGGGFTIESGEGAWFAVDVNDRLGDSPVSDSVVESLAVKEWLGDVVNLLARPVAEPETYADGICWAWSDKA